MTGPAWNQSGCGSLGQHAVQVFLILRGVLVALILNDLFVALEARRSAVQLLGPGRAAVFPALVPAVAILLGVPLVGEWPTLLQATGLAVVTSGLLIAIGSVRLPYRRS